MFSLPKGRVVLNPDTAEFVVQNAAALLAL